MRRCGFPILFALLLAAPSSWAAGEAERSLAGGMNDFACSFYKQVKGQEGSNLFFSPYSIQIALGMTYGGARGETAAAMELALRFAPRGKALHAAMGGLMGSLNSAGKGGLFELAVANALWLDRSEKLLKAFVAQNRVNYKAGLERLNFQRNAEGARKHINAWVEKQTKERIKDLLKPGDVDSDTRLVLTNAIYFKGKWAAKFNKARTSDGPFTRADGTKVQVPLMRQTARLPLSAGEDFQLLGLPYQGDRLSMVILLPGKPDGLAGLESRLSATWLATQIGKARPQKVFVSLPRFTMTERYELKKPLAAMGMGIAFSGKADFSGMNGKGGLTIGAVIHKAFVAVDEEGTEAAGATAVVMTRGFAKKPPAFRAEHPFLFVIRDDVSGAILFMGRVMDPSDQGN